MAELRKEASCVVKANRPRPILFDHIPKCAGSTLGHYLQVHYPHRKTFHLDGKNPRASVEAFRRMPEVKRHAFALIKGHLAGQLIDAVHLETLKITVLREPIDRIVSHYFYARRNPAHYLHDKINREGLSLKQYVEMGLSHELQNHYTLHFSGLNLEQAEADPEASIALALDGIRRFDLVGVQDDLSGFIEALRREAGLIRPAPEQKNECHAKPKKVFRSWIQRHEKQLSRRIAST